MTETVCFKDPDNSGDSRLHYSRNYQESVFLQPLIEVLSERDDDFGEDVGEHQIISSGNGFDAALFYFNFIF